MTQSDLMLGTELGGMPLRAASHARTPWLYLPLGGLPRGAARLRANLRYLRGGDVIAFSSFADVDMFHNLVATCSAEIKILPLFVEQDMFRPLDPRRRRDFRRDLGIGAAQVVFLYAGRITAEKNVHFLVRHLAHLLSRNENASLLIVGPDWNAPFQEFRGGPFDFRRVMHEVMEVHPKIADRIQLLGPVPRHRLPDVYGAADVFVSTTLHHDENFGFTQVEAMSAGLPVVGTNWGGLKDTIRNGVNGYLIDTWMTDWGVRADAGQLLQACERLLRSGALRMRMAQASRRIATDEYGLPAFRRRLLDLVSFCLESRKTETPTAPNRFTPFGRRYDRSMRNKGAIRYARSDYDLYENLLLPYCSGRNQHPVCPDDLISGAAHSLVVNRRGVEVRDPLWPGRHRINAVERRLLSKLTRSSLPSLRVEELVNGDGRSNVYRALQRLTRLGVVVRTNCDSEGFLDASGA